MPNPDALLFARHIEHRQQQTDTLMAELGYDGLLIHSGRPEMRLFDDQHPPFRAHAAFSAWVPRPFAADCLLELRPGRKPRLWFVQPRDFWHLPPEPPADWWADVLDVEVVASPEDWHDVFANDRALAVIGRERDLGKLLGNADLNPEALVRGLDEIRTRKTAWERECLARANHTAARAHLAAGEAFRRGASELAIHLEYLAAAGQDQDELPYNSIVALNEHCAVLHYQHRAAATPAASRSFLIDAGAHDLGYAADITRTHADASQQTFIELIQAVERAQQLLCEQLRPGVSFGDLHHEAHLAIAGILEQAGLVDMTPEAQVETGVSAFFLPHGLGHFIGLQVHDVAGQRAPDGRALPPPEAYPALRLTRELEVGNVVTVEPGLYFIPMLLERLRGSEFSRSVDWPAVEALMPCGGIRIEDNVLVTENEPINFTRSAFSALRQA